MKTNKGFFNRSSAGAGPISPRLIAVSLCAAVSGLPSAAFAASGAACDARCLNGVMDQYLSQVLKHDPKPLPVAANAITVENAVASKLGEASWKTIQAYPVPGHSFADVSNGQIVHYNATTTTEGKVGSIYVRLKVVNKQIVESEIMSRGAYTAEGAAAVGLLEPDILYTAVVPEARRSTRAQMLKVVDLYMDGISQHSGAVFPAGSRCDRYQAGNKFTNVVETLNRGGGTCQGSMNNLTGQTVVNRRFPVVDEALGIAVVHFIIPHEERTPKNSTNVAEVFKIVDGKVRSIEEFSFIGASPATSGFADEPSGVLPLVRAGATLQKVADGFAFTEGPATDLAGNVYFSDITNNRINRWDAATGKITAHRENTGRGNGNMFDASGNLITLEMDNHRAVRDNLKGDVKLVADSYDGKPLHMLNDLWVDYNGGIYVTDFNGAGPGAAPVEGGMQVYYLPPGGKPAVKATHDLVGPNGIAGSLDGKQVYVTEPATRKTWIYDVGPNGVLQNKKLFVDDFADGFKLDEYGNLYFTGEKITIYSPAGKKLQELSVPGGRSANLAFAGKDGKTLFVTAMSTVYTLQMNVRGAPTPLERANGRMR